MAAIAIAVALGLTALLSVAPASAAVEENMTIPLEGLVFDDAFCGEGFVHTGGNLHILMTRTENANRVTMTFHFQPQGAKLVGLDSGDEYVGTGVTRETVTEALDGGPSNFTFVNNFRIIGKGATPNYTEHIVSHVTVNASGEMTAEIDKVSIVCH